MSQPDVDIDFADREQILKLLDHTPAMIKESIKEKTTMRI